MASIDTAPSGLGRALRKAGVVLAAAMTMPVAFVPVGAGAATPAKNTVDVIFDSSLTDTMAVLAPTFHKATGLSMLQTAGESAVDAKDLAGKTTVQDVFVSEGAAPVKSLEAKNNGNLVSWYAQLGATPLLLAYNPKSKFAKDLRTMPWYKVVTMKGFLLGRATSDTDSSGSLAVMALDAIAKSKHLPALSELATSKADLYSEADLVARLQQGHLAAAFVYGVDAATGGLKTVPLASVNLAAPYVITILHDSAHEGAAVTFVKFLLRASTVSTLDKGGLIEKIPLPLTGKATAVPPPLRSLVS